MFFKTLYYRLFFELDTSSDYFTVFVKNNNIFDDIGVLDLLVSTVIASVYTKLILGVNSEVFLYSKKNFKYRMHVGFTPTINLV